MPDSHKNFAYSTVAPLGAPSPASSGTSLTVASGDGAKFPATPFNATVWPASAQPTTANAEIVRVTAISTDTLTITRAQESTSARSIGAGDQIAATITAKTLTDIETPRVRRVGPPAIVCDGNSTASLTAVLPQTPTAGNLLIATVLMWGFSSVPSAATPTGWTLVRSTTGSAGSNIGVVAVFYKVAAGGDSAPTFTISNPNSTVLLVEEWKGLATSSPVRVSADGPAQTNAPQQISATNLTGLTAGDLVYLAYCVRGQGARILPCGPLVMSLPPTAPKTGLYFYAGTATMLAASSSESPAVVYGDADSLFGPVVANAVAFIPA